MEAWLSSARAIWCGGKPATAAGQLGERFHARQFQECCRASAVPRWDEKLHQHMEVPLLRALALSQVCCAHQAARSLPFQLRMAWQAA